MDLVTLLTWVVLILINIKKTTQMYPKTKSDHTCKLNHEVSAGKNGGYWRGTYILDQSKLRNCSIQNITVQSNIFILRERLSRKNAQKRVGNQLRKLTKTMEGLAELGLVDRVIDRFQNYYGMAIRTNIGNLEKRKKVMFAG